jgi:TonB family protein
VRAILHPEGTENMREIHRKNHLLQWARSGVVRVAAIGLVVAMALPASAANDRAVKTKVPPVYPELAKRMKITGVVKVEATVDPDGKVTGVKVISGNSALQNAAEDAVRKWKFVAGDATDTVNVDVNFAMAGQ